MMETVYAMTNDRVVLMQSFKLKRLVDGSEEEDHLKRLVDGSEEEDHLKRWVDGSEEEDHLK